MCILGTQRDPNSHTPLSQIPSFFRAHSIPPNLSAEPNPPGINREDDDDYPKNTQYEDASDNGSTEILPDQDQENEDEGDGVQKIDYDQEDTIAYISRFKRKKRSNIYTQISEVIIHSIRFFKCKYCAQKYKSTGGTRNMRENLTKNHGWDGLTTVQLNFITRNCSFLPPQLRTEASSLIY